MLTPLAKINVTEKDVGNINARLIKIYRVLLICWCVSLYGILCTAPCSYTKIVDTFLADLSAKEYNNLIQFLCDGSDIVTNIQ